MPFAWQPLGALQGGVPNQMPSFTPKNTEGLGFPGGQVMFNLPRFQMPGTTVNFGGMMPAGNMSFSITRQASSDPVQNIINDIQNPLGNTNISFGGSPASNTPAPKPSPMDNLRSTMMKASEINAQAMPPTIGEASQGLTWGGTPELLHSLAGGNLSPQSLPFSLRSRMLSNPRPMPLTQDIFI